MLLTLPPASTAQLWMALKWKFCRGAYCAAQSAWVFCTTPFSSVVRLISVAGPPLHIQGRRKRVSDLGSTGPDKAAAVQLLPPFAEMSTCFTRPKPDHARPEIS